MPQWNNWSGALTSRPSALHFPRSEADVQAIAEHAARNKATVRVAGANHSHAPLVQHDDLLIDLKGLSGVISTDNQANSAWVWAGSRIYALGRPLHDAGMALSNQGDIDEQAIGGATATGTHGTGAGLKNLSSAVIGARIVLAGGEIVECSAEQNQELWRATQLNLGSIGIITQLQMQLRPAYRLIESRRETTLDEALEAFPEGSKNNRHHEFFWYPQTDNAVVKSINETTEGPIYPLADEGSRCAWSYEVLPNHRPHKHTEMEYSVPAESAATCMGEIRELLANRFTDVRWPVEYRCQAADDVWMSAACGRDTITISVHQGVDEPDEPYFRACEEIFLAYQGRPHWGKVNYLSGTQLAERHRDWASWWSARDKADPNGLFLNEYMQSLR